MIKAKAKEMSGFPFHRSESPKAKRARNGHAGWLLKKSMPSKEVIFLGFTGWGCIILSTLC
jgi:hypothetical protein